MRSFISPCKCEFLLLSQEKEAVGNGILHLRRAHVKRNYVSGTEENNIPGLIFPRAVYGKELLPWAVNLSNVFTRSTNSVAQVKRRITPCGSNGKSKNDKRNCTEKVTA